jgi:hypothetical protein
MKTDTHSIRVAHESIEWILNNHRPEPLPEEIWPELKQIVAAADQDENLRIERRWGEQMYGKSN